MRGARPHDWMMYVIDRMRSALDSGAGKGGIRRPGYGGSRSFGLGVQKEHFRGERAGALHAIESDVLARLRPMADFQYILPGAVGLPQGSNLYLWNPHMTDKHKKPGIDVQDHNNVELIQQKPAALRINPT